MDDVDAVQAQIAHNMLQSGDWVTARLDGIAYLEKSPFVYWAMAASFAVFGVHDWAARIPIVLAIILLCWLTTCFGMWAFGRRAGFYAGLCLATCVGLFLFTRILIPDVMLVGTIALSMWAFLRLLEEEEPHPRLWAYIGWASMAIGLLLKSLIALVFPIGAALVYLLVTRQLFLRRTWQRLHVYTGLLLLLAIAAPWHVLATIRNPPYFAWTMKSGPGEYHGFLWFYFINEQLLRFLNMRYPRDYNTVPRLWFWLFNLVWLFPWSVYVPGAVGLSYKPDDRAGRARLLALCWIGFLMVFFTFSTTQEYYSMPIYPALALLIGSAMAAEGRWVRYGNKVLAVITALAATVVGVLLYMVRGVPTPGDISSALSYNPSVYTLSLGHMEDLTIRSFAYLRQPLLLAGIAFLVGAIGAWRYAGKHTMRGFVLIAVMMVLFLEAARMAMIVFNPYMSSQPLSKALQHAPPGKLVVDDAYYAFSSVFFYTNRQALLLNGRKNNLEYGSFAPDAPKVFIDNQQFRKLWLGNDRCYVLAYDRQIPKFDQLVGRDHLFTIANQGGKFLMTNKPLDPKVSSNFDPWARVATEPMPACGG
ncbi:MAG: glycosyltransferase family 39 protein [Acidobacteriota bacterium]|nr:glycosyltransferase family 39 protein [Acidobacteriota bacterium]